MDDGSWIRELHNEYQAPASSKEEFSAPFYEEVHMLRTDITRLTSENNRLKKQIKHPPAAPDVEKIQAELRQAREHLHTLNAEIRRLTALLQTHAPAPTAPTSSAQEKSSPEQFIRSKDMLIRGLRQQNASLRRDLQELRAQYEA